VRVLGKRVGVGGSWQLHVRRLPLGAARRRAAGTSSLRAPVSREHPCDALLVCGSAMAKDGVHAGMCVCARACGRQGCVERVGRAC
jgi:hypothetical protein